MGSEGEGREKTKMSNLSDPPIDDDEIEELSDRCTCKEFNWEDYCPFDLDVWGTKTLCNCCPFCMQECGDSI